MSQGYATRLALAKDALRHHRYHRPVRRMEIEHLHIAAGIARAYAELLASVKRAVETLHANRDKAVMVAACVAMLPWERL